MELTFLSRSFQYLWCGLTSVAFVIALTVIGLDPRWAVLNYLLAPGFLLAALIFPEGAHSGRALIYLSLAVAIDVLLWTVVFRAIWMRFRHSRGQDRHA